MLLIHTDAQSSAMTKQILDIGLSGNINETEVQQKSIFFENMNPDTRKILNLVFLSLFSFVTILFLVLIIYKSNPKNRDQLGNKSLEANYNYFLIPVFLLSLVVTCYYVSKIIFSYQNPKVELASMDKFNFLHDQFTLHEADSIKINESFKKQHTEHKTKINTLDTKQKQQEKLIKDNNDATKKALDNLVSETASNKSGIKNNFESIQKTKQDLEQQKIESNENKKSILSNQEQSTQIAKNVLTLTQFSNNLNSKISALSTENTEQNQKIGTISGILKVKDGKSETIDGMKSDNQNNANQIQSLQDKFTALNNITSTNTTENVRINQNIENLTQQQIITQLKVDENAIAMNKSQAQQDDAIKKLAEADEALLSQMEGLAENIAKNASDIDEQNNNNLFISIFMNAQNKKSIKILLDAEDSVDVILNNLMVLNSTQFNYDISQNYLYNAYILKYCINRMISNGKTKLEAAQYLLNFIVKNQNLVHLDEFAPTYSKDQLQAFSTKINNSLSTNALTNTLSSNYNVDTATGLSEMSSLPLVLKQAFLIGLYTIYGQNTDFWTTINAGLVPAINDTYKAFTSGNTKTDITIKSPSSPNIAENTLLMVSFFESSDATKLILNGIFTGNNLTNTELIAQTFNEFNTYNIIVGGQTLTKTQITTLRQQTMNLTKILTEIVPSDFATIAKDALTNLDTFFTLNSFGVAEYEALILNPIAKEWLSSSANDQTKLFGIEQLVNFGTKLSNQEAYTSLMHYTLQNSTQLSSTLIQKIISKFLFVVNSTVNGFTSSTVNLAPISNKQYKNVEITNLLNEIQTALQTNMTMDPSAIFKTIMQAVDEANTFMGVAKTGDTTFNADQVNPINLFDGYVAAPSRSTWTSILADGTAGLANSSDTYRSQIAIGALVKYLMSQNSIDSTTKSLMLKDLLGNGDFTLSSTNYNKFIVAILTALKTKQMTPNAIASLALGHTNSNLDSSSTNTIMSDLLMNLFEFYTGQNPINNSATITGFQALITGSTVNSLFGSMVVGTFDIANLVAAINNLYQNTDFGMNALIGNAEDKQALGFFALLAVLRFGVKGTNIISIDDLNTAISTFKQNGLTISFDALTKFFVPFVLGTTPQYSLDSVFQMLKPHYSGTNLEMDFGTAYINSLIDYDKNISKNNTAATKIQASKFIAALKKYLDSSSPADLNSLMNDALSGLTTIENGSSLTENTINNSSKYNLINLFSYLSMHKKQANKSEIPTTLGSWLASILADYKLSQTNNNTNKWNNFGQFFNNEPIQMINNSLKIAGKPYVIDIIKKAFSTLIQSTATTDEKNKVAGLIMSGVFHTLFQLYQAPNTGQLGAAQISLTSSNLTSGQEFDSTKFAFSSTDTTKLDGQLQDIFSNIGNTGMYAKINNEIAMINGVNQLMPDFAKVLLQVFSIALADFATLQGSNKTTIAQLMVDTMFSCEYSMISYFMNYILTAVFANDGVISGTQATAGNNFFATTILPAIANEIVSSMRPTSENAFQKIGDKLGIVLTGVSSTAIVSGLALRTSEDTVNSKRYTVSFSTGGNIVDVKAVTIIYKVEDITNPSSPVTETSYTYQVTFRQ